MSRQFNYERAAYVLVDALTMGDKAAAKKWDVSIRTIERWRSLLQEDQLLAEFFAKRQKDRTDAWASEIPQALVAILSYISEAGREADRKCPETMKAMAQAFKVIADVEMSKQVLDKRIFKTDDD